MYNYCKCGIPNGYRHPAPRPREMRFLDTVKVEKFTVNRVKESCVEECCEPKPVGVSVKNSVLILSGVTHCIEPDVYYSFDLDRSVPIDWNAYQVFIKAEPCGFFRGAVELEETEITVPFCGEERFKFTEENIGKYYRAKDLREGEEDCHERKDREFLEVDLDLRGNLAVSGYFLRSYSLNPQYGAKHRYVLYMNNAGRLVLTRSICESRKYGDFDL